jgi:hypothetical protein
MWVKMKLAFGTLLVSAMALWAFEGTTANRFVWGDYRNST